jgi:hypothetical protein
MYDEMTNSDFICVMNKAAEDDFSSENARIMNEAARRIRKLENMAMKADID